MNPSTQLGSMYFIKVTYDDVANKIFFKSQIWTYSLGPHTTPQTHHPKFGGVIM